MVSTNHSFGRVILACLTALLGFSGPTVFAATQLSSNNTTNEGVKSFWVTGNGQVVYAGDLLGTGYRLFAASTSEAGTQRLIGHDPAAASERAPGRTEISDDGRFVVYEAFPGTGGALRSLYSIDLENADAEAKLSHLPNADGTYHMWQLAGDGSAMFVGVPTGASGRQVFRASLNGTGNAQQLTTLPSGANINGMSLMGDSPHAVFSSPFESSGSSYSLYNVPVAGGATVRVNHLLTHGNDARWGQATPDGQHIIYRIDGGSYPNRNQNLYMAELGAANTQTRIDQLPSGKVAWDWRAAPDSTFVVYMGGPADSKGPSDIYIGSLTNPGSGFKINTPSKRNVAGSIQSFELTPDGSHVYYTGFLTHTDAVDLYSASTTTPNTQIQLNSRTNSTGRAHFAQTTQDGSRIVYRGNLMSDEQELFSASVNQTGTQIRLSGALEAGTGAGNFLLTPDTDRVIFGKRAPGRAVAEPYAAPVDQADSETNLLRLEANQTYNNLAVNGTSDIALFRTTATIYDVAREFLFAAFLDGGAPVRLNDPLPDHGRIGDVQIGPDGDAVFFLADTLVTEETVSSNPAGIPGHIGETTVLQQHADLFMATLPQSAGPLGDMNLDNLVDVNDVNAFILGYRNPQLFAFKNGLSPLNYGDMNQDGIIDQNDIDLFAAATDVTSDQITSAIDDFITGDFDGDNEIGELDLALILHYWGATTEPGEAPLNATTWINTADVTGSIVGQAELALVLRNWGNTAAILAELDAVASATGLNENEIGALIPEPATATTTVLVILSLLMRRRHAT